MTDCCPRSSIVSRVAGHLATWLTIERLVIAVVVLASALAMSPNVADPDLWGHVQYGRDVLRDGLPETTTYSFTATGYPWVNHENLSEIAMAITADWFGPLGLVAGKFLLSLLVIGLILGWNLRSGNGLVASSIITLLVAANLGYHWSIRPQVISFVCFALLIGLFQFAFSGWRDNWHLTFRRKGSGDESNDNTTSAPIEIRQQLGYQSRRMKSLWLLVPLMVVWTNSHGGFVAGLAIALAYLGMRALEALCRGGNQLVPNAGWGLVRRMTLMATVAVLASGLNPYGPGLHWWLAYDLGIPRPEISDWNSNPLWTLVGMKFWVLLAVAGFSMAASRRKPDATQLVILALALWQSLTHFRHVPFFAIAAGFWVGPHLQAALQRLASTGKQRALSRRSIAGLRAALVAVLLATSVALGIRLSDLQVERDKYPVDALAFMREHGLHGRLVVTFDWAQYAIAALCTDEFAPAQRSAVAFDGRIRTCYPQTLADMHFDFLFGDSPHMPRRRSPQSPPVDPSRVLSHGDPDLVLLRRFGERSEQHMQAHRDEWIVLYQDATAQVWGRRSVFDDPASPRWFDPARREIHDQRAVDSVTWPAIATLPPRGGEEKKSGRPQRATVIDIGPQQTAVIR